MVIIAIAKTILFFASILIVSAVVFSSLVGLIGKYFNVTLAQDSVFAKSINKLRHRL